MKKKKYNSRGIERKAKSAKEKERSSNNEQTRK